MSTCRKTIGSLYTIRKFPFIQNIIETKFVNWLHNQQHGGQCIFFPCHGHCFTSLGRWEKNGLIVARRGREIILSFSRGGGARVRPSAQRKKGGEKEDYSPMGLYWGLDFSTPHPLPPPPLPRRRRRRPSLRTIPQCRAPGRP